MDKHLVVFQRYDFSFPTRSLRFTTTTFWVQIHGLPISMLEPETAIEIGETIGTVSLSEHVKEMIGGDFLRVRVEIDVTKPLYRGRKIAINDSEVVWVSLKYEKLSNFCYWSGRVSHSNKECEVWLASKATLRTNQQEYGAWLRAVPHNPRKLTFTTVTRMGDGFGRSPTESQRKRYA